MKNQFKNVLALLLIIFSFNACKKAGCTDPEAINYDSKAKKDNSLCEYASTNNGSYVLLITTGAQTFGLNESTTYTAVLIDKEGNETTPSSVSWSASDQSVCSISSSGLLTTSGIGYATIQASATINGNTYTTSVLVNVSIKSAFTVLPSLVMLFANEQMPLQPIFFTNESVTYTYTSANTSIASVSSQGVVTTVSPGSTSITVQAQTSSATLTTTVPVLVLGSISIELPITKIIVTPGSVDLFKGDNATLSAKAYNLSGEEVSTSFEWTSVDPSIASVNSSGVITGLANGSTYIQASSKGIVGQAEVLVSPDTIVLVSPITASVGQGATKQFTAKAYNAKTSPMTQYTSITNFNWYILDYGPGFEMFNIGTVSNSGLLSVKQDAISGMSSALVAEIPGTDLGGISLVSVSVFSSDCGAGNADVESIVVNNGNTINISLTGNPQVQIDADALDGFGGMVANPLLKYNSDDTNVVMIDDETGFATALSPGTAIITICSGSYASKTITINVTF